MYLYVVWWKIWHNILEVVCVGVSCHSMKGRAYVCIICMHTATFRAIILWLNVTTNENRLCWLSWLVNRWPTEEVLEWRLLFFLVASLQGSNVKLCSNTTQSLHNFSRPHPLTVSRTDTVWRRQSETPPLLQASPPETLPLNTPSPNTWETRRHGGVSKPCCVEPESGGGGVNGGSSTPAAGHQERT